MGVARTGSAHGEGADHARVCVCAENTDAYRLQFGRSVALQSAWRSHHVRVGGGGDYDGKRAAMTGPLDGNAQATVTCVVCQDWHMQIVQGAPVASVV